MAGTKPRMTKQHTRAAALPGKPCFPTGAARCKRHPDSGAAGSAGALFCTRALSFASENDLMQVLGLIPGAVTPIGLLNDAECKVQLYLDEVFFAAPGLIGVHPNDSTATVWLRADDLVALIQEHGNPVHIAEL